MDTALTTESAHGLGHPAGTSNGPERRAEFDETLQQLLGILGPDCSQLEARQLLHAANGDLAAALNAHCDHAAGDPPGMRICLHACVLPALRSYLHTPLCCYVLRTALLCLGRCPLVFLGSQNKRRREWGVTCLSWAAGNAVNGGLSAAQQQDGDAAPALQTSTPEEALPQRKDSAKAAAPPMAGGGSKRKPASAGSNGGAAKKPRKAAASTPASKGSLKGAAKGRKAASVQVPSQQRTLDSFFGSAASKAAPAAAAAVAGMQAKAMAAVGKGAAAAIRPVIEIPAMPCNPLKEEQSGPAGACEQDYSAAAAGYAAVEQENVAAEQAVQKQEDAAEETGKAVDVRPVVEDLTGGEQPAAGMHKPEQADGAEDSAAEPNGLNVLKEEADMAEGAAVAVAVKEEEDISTGMAAQKQEDEEGAWVKDEEDEQQRQEVKHEDGEAAGKPLLQQMGAYASARAATTGVANALIEKRKVSLSTQQAGKKGSAKRKEAAAAAAALAVGASACCNFPLLSLDCQHLVRSTKCWLHQLPQLRVTPAHACPGISC